MKIRTLGYFTREATTGLLRNGLMTFTAVVTITLALITLGSFYIVVNNVNNFTEMAKGILEVRVYLDDNADVVRVQNQILGFDGVKSVNFVPKSEGARQLGKTLGIKELDNYLVEDNPLPDMINIKLKDEVSLKTLTARLKNVSGVEEVKYGQEFVESLLVVLRVIWLVGSGLIIIIGIVVLYIVVNTIRLTVLSRRKEIEIMKLVGATDWFVRWPFIIEGIILGLIGAGLTVLVIIYGYHLLSQYIEQLAPFIPLLGQRVIAERLFLLIGLAGLAFGMVGSMVSIKRFLKV